MKLKYLLILFISITALSIVGCSDDDLGPTGITTKPEDPDDNTDPDIDFIIPSYADDYSAIASWDKRNEWNLANVHDPSVAYYNGYYYMYGTDASYGNSHEGHGHFQGKRSTDLVNWEWVGGPFYEAPSWVADSLNAIRLRMNLEAIANDNIQYGYWAPVVRRVNVGGQEILRMYYSIVIHNYIKTGNPTTASFDGSWTERAFIGMCESTDPAGAVWEDKGFVTTSSSDRGLDFSRASISDWSGYFYYNAIDPTYIVSPEGNHYLIHGSWHSGFALLQVDATTGKPLNTLGNPWADNASELTARYGARVGTRSNGSRWQASEAPEVIYKDGYYYLFMAYDGLDVPYNTRVVRSENIEGPYYDITGRNFTNGQGDSYPIVTHPYKFNLSNGWVGIAHCCIFQKENTDEWFYMSQGRLPVNVGGNPFSNAIMMGHVRRIVWCPASVNEPNNLWPIALPERYAGVPEEYGTITENELIGTWEHINLSYRFAQQNSATGLTLKSDGTMTGALTGNWSYNESKKQLTLGNVIVCVEREVDWEASPRRVTLVYAGTEKNLNATYWGKKSK
ncbi:arabinan endo-1,5-alpha-L-arabinosidase [Draconibacterium mangrovi]|uniref:arabinan endo-1,5-alpha-L-arabinosidase n=1 Tax=Draconibacterium mangrovi TaxID=2697469 RepID=UPI0013D8AE52|nr:glycoside hydrolase family 43 protein [Draconibacterium mangrovi]